MVASRLVVLARWSAFVVGMLASSAPCRSVQLVASAATASLVKVDDVAR